MQAQRGRRVKGFEGTVELPYAHSPGPPEGGLTWRDQRQKPANRLKQSFGAKRSFPGGTCSKQRVRSLLVRGSEATKEIPIAPCQLQTTRTRVQLWKCPRSLLESLVKRVIAVAAGAQLSHSPQATRWGRGRQGSSRMQSCQEPKSP